MSSLAAKPAVLFLGGSPELAAALGRALKGRVELALERGFEQAVAAAQRLRPKAAIVELSSSAEAALQAMDELHRAMPGVPLVALAARKDPELILRAMRAGAREFAVHAEESELARVVLELVQQALSQARPGEVITLFPTNGGVGTTTLATNLAGALRVGNERVVLVDLDLHLGDVLVFLDLAPRFTALEVLANMKRLDRDLLASSLAKHPSGLHVVAQSDRLEEADQVGPEQVRDLLRFLAHHFDYVVVDGLRGFDETSLAALDVTDRVLLVMSQNVPSMKNAHRCLGVFRRLGVPEAKTCLVVNRFQKADPIDLPTISDSLGQAVTGVVANDYPAVIASINKGVLLTDAAPRSRVAEDLRGLAGLISGRGAKKSGGFFRALFGGKPAAKKSNDAVPVGGDA